MTLNISHLTFSESGGAGVVAKSLAIAQSRMGHNVKFVAATTGTLTSQAISNPMLVAQGVFDYFIVRKDSKSSLFSLFRSQGNLKIKLGIDSKEVLNIHWPLGVLNLKDIYSLTQNGKVFWTLHDTWAFTGGCHYEQGCQKFEAECQHCPQTKKIFRNKVLNTKLEKNKFFQNNKNLIVITPSAWLKEMAVKSRTFYEQNIHHIPNGIDHNIFKPIPSQHRLGSHEITLGICAVDLLDRRKNVYGVLSWIKKISNKKTKLNIILQGKNAEKFLEASDYFTIEKRSYSREEMPIFYSELDYFINLSIAENLPTTVLEAQACGTPVIVNSIGGSSEIVTSGRNGFIVDEFSQLEDILIDKSKKDTMVALKTNSRKLSLEKYDINVVAAKYIDLYAKYN